MLALLTSAAFSFAMGSLYPVAQRRISRNLNKQSVGGLFLVLLAFFLTFGLSLLASYLVADVLEVYSPAAYRLVLAPYTAGVVIVTLEERWRASRRA